MIDMYVVKYIYCGDVRIYLIIIKNNTQKMIEPIIKKITDTENSVKAGDHISRGPFVRISQSSGRNFIYITVFFDRKTIKNEKDILLKTCIESDNFSITITANKETDITSKEQSLWSIIYFPNEGKIDAKSVNVTVNFNDPNHPESLENPNDLEAPKRGTVVIPPSLHNEKK
jgi:hypothetical protein